jgi:uncharacterized protein involved in exopolysaccharide biosynthesis
MELRDVIRILKRRKWLVLACAVLALGAQWMTLRARPRTFVARGEYRLRVAVERLPEALRPADILRVPGGATQILVEYQQPADLPEVLIRSDAVVKRAVERLRERGSR